MDEPIFFDCLTDAQCWSLFELGVLQHDGLPADVYDRLERIAPDYGCYLFTWHVGTAVPPLRDLVPNVAPPGEASRLPAERIDSILEGFRAAVQSVTPPEGLQVYVISTRARLEIRAGPSLQPRVRDLNAMSIPELEAYLNGVLQLDEAVDSDPAGSPTGFLTPLPEDRGPLRGRTASGNA